MRAHATALCLFVLAAAVAAAAGDDDRLVVLAEFKPADGSEWQAWRMFIHDDGIIDIETPEANRQPQSRRLDRTNLQKFLTAFERWRVDELDDRYSVMGGEGVETIDGANDLLSLRVRRDGEIHKVTLEVPEYAVGLQDRVAANAKRSEIERFLNVWSAALRYGGAPNPEQTRKLYKP